MSGHKYLQIPTASLIPDYPPCRQGESPDYQWPCLSVKIEQRMGLSGNFCGIFRITAINRCSKRLYRCKRNERAKWRTVLKGMKMFKSIRTHFRAAVTLIVIENLKALRVLLKSLMESVSNKSSRQYKKTWQAFQAASHFPPSRTFLSVLNNLPYRIWSSQKSGFSRTLGHAKQKRTWEKREFKQTKKKPLLLGGRGGNKAGA